MQSIYTPKKTNWILASSINTTIVDHKDLIWVYIGVESLFWNTNRKTKKSSFCTYFSHITLSLINCIDHYPLAGELFGSNICQELTQGMLQLRSRLKAMLTVLIPLDSSYYVPLASPETNIHRSNYLSAPSKTLFDAFKMQNEMN